MWWAFSVLCKTCQEQVYYNYKFGIEIKQRIQFSVGEYVAFEAKPWLWMIS